MDNFLDKLWLQKSNNDTIIQRCLELIDELGKALPCSISAVSGQIVTVDFSTMDTTPWVLPSVQVPAAQSPYFYWPFQVGDTGVVLPMDAHVGTIAGLTTALPSLRLRPANLSALVFWPVGKKSFTPANAQAAQIQGPDGVVLQTMSGTTSSVVTNQSGTTVTFGSSVLVVENNEISMTAGGHSVVINSSGISIDGVIFVTHEHSGVTTGTGNTGGVV